MSQLTNNNLGLSGHQGPASRLPSFEYAFARSRSLMQAGRIGGAVSFSRPSPGRYLDAGGVLRTAAVGEARIKHDVNGRPLGLSLEPVVDNRQDQPTEFSDDSDWNVSSDSEVEKDVAVAPNGQVEADRFYHTVDTGASGIRSISGGISPDADYVFDFYYKNENARWLRVSLDTNGDKDIGEAWLDTQNDSWGQVNADTSLSVLDPEVLPDGWRRAILLGRTSAGTSTLTKQFRVADGDGSTGEPADESILLWGAQLEAGDHPTSFIVGTREADELQVDNLGDRFANEATLVLAGEMPIQDGDFLVFNDGTANEQVKLTATGSDLTVEFVSGGTSQGSFTSTVGLAGSGFTITIFADGSTAEVHVDSGAPVERIEPYAGADLSGNGILPTGLNQMQAYGLGWTFRYVGVWPFRF